MPVPARCNREGVACVASKLVSAGSALQSACGRGHLAWRFRKARMFCGGMTTCLMTQIPDLKLVSLLYIEITMHVIAVHFTYTLNDHLKVVKALCTDSCALCYCKLRRHGSQIVIINLVLKKVNTEFHITDIARS